MERYSRTVCLHPLSSSPFLPSFSLTCCAFLSTSFNNKGSYLRRWLVLQSSDGPQADVFLSHKLNARMSVHRHGFTPLSSFLSDKRNVTVGANDRWLETRSGVGSAATLASFLFYMVSISLTEIKTKLYTFSSYRFPSALRQIPGDLYPTLLSPFSSDRHN